MCADVEAGEQVDAVQQGRMVELRLGERVTVSMAAALAAPRNPLGLPKQAEWWDVTFWGAPISSRC